MTLTEKLQNLIQSSEFLKRVQEIKNSIKTIDKEYRPLTDAEISVLEKNRNSAEDWKQINVKEEFSPQYISGNRFFGKCRLGVFTGMKHNIQDGALFPSGIYDSVIINSFIESEALIFQCRLISNYYISENTVIYNTGSITALCNCNSGNSLVIPVGPETGEIPFPLFADMDMESAELILNSAHKPAEYSDYITVYRNSSNLETGYIGKNCIITGTSSIRDSFIGDSAEIRGALLITGSTLLSSTDEKISIGSGVRIEGSMIQYGCGINSGAIIFNSLLMEHTESENQSRVSSSIIGPNSSLAGGEVTSTLAGPFTVSHHQSLLIATVWPGGRGNIGYGANVGSNHTSRLPDQELYPGEGMFFGLGCSIKFPGDYRRAPYSIVATGTVTQSQRVEFPFSLILSPSVYNKGVSLHLNELIPGWTLRENIYAVLRNESKYRSRNKSKRNIFDFTILRPSIIDLMITARERLEKAADFTICFTERDIPGAGKNFITDESRLKGIDTYSFYIRHYLLTALFSRTEEVIKANRLPEFKNIMEPDGTGYWGHAVKLVKSELPADISLKSALETLILSIEKIYKDTFDSRKKDYKRGVNTIENYSLYHKSPENDLSLGDIRKSTEARVAGIREVITVLN
jgi:NDP-sugar pyrophosphorylase family protein